MATTRTSTCFTLRYAVEATLDAPPSAVWARLTDAAAFPSWNTTVTRVDGTIALGQTLAIQVPTAPGRTFSPKVVELVAQSRMVWQDGSPAFFQGTRTFTLTPAGSGTTFTMVEEFRGLFTPLIGRVLPDFRPVFDQYVRDLAAACPG